MEFHALDWFAIGAYILIALAIGARLTGRASRSTKDFYLAGRSLPWWIAGTSLVATSFAADTPLVVTGWVRSAGVAQNWIWWGMALGGCLSFSVLAAYWRRLRVTTDAEFIERRYSGNQAKVLRGVYGGYHALVSNTIILTWVLVAMVKLSRALVPALADGAHDTWVVGGALLLALTYSVLAGLYGVTMTDLLQFLVAMAGSIALVWIVVAEAGGLSATQDLIAQTAGDKARLLPLPVKGEDDPWTAVSFLTQGFTAFLVFFGLQGWANKNADGGGVAVQRYSACISDEHARGAALWYHVAHYALRPWPWIIVALVSIHVIGDAELPLLDNGEPDHEMAYPMMMVEYLSRTPGLFGLVCAGMLAAFMSTLDTHFNLASAYIVNDLYRRFAAKGRTERHYVWVGRGVEVLIGVLAAIFALAADSIDQLFKLTLALLAGVGPAMLLRWFWWRANAWTEISALVSSTMMTLLLKFVVPASAWPAAPFNGYEGGVAWNHAGQYILIVAVSLVVMLVATFTTPPVDLDHLKKFYRSVEPIGRWKPIHKGQKTTIVRRATPGALVTWLGGVCFVLGLTMLIGSLLLNQPWQLYAWLTWGGLMGMIWGWQKAAPPILA